MSKIHLLNFRPNKFKYLVVFLLCMGVVWILFAWQTQLSYLDETKIVELFGKKITKSKFNAISQRTGLTAVGPRFKLDGKPITIISGAVHYFRMPAEYWHDRLLKMKFGGLNTIETYVPWNVHEPTPGNFDFSGNLDLTRFLLMAYKLDFLVILRPGPYICSEWDFGGLPSWLLRDPNMKVRTLYPNYLDAVVNYFAKLLPMIRPLQYKSGGPIVAFQIENEYGSYYEDPEHVFFLKELMVKHGIRELLFMSDNEEGLVKQRNIPDVLRTVNFKYVEDNFDQLQSIQPYAPMMVMEFWSGWFDNWGKTHQTLSIQEFSESLNGIFSVGASVNFYMYFGGTNFGFMNGAFPGKEGYISVTTSYDYDAVIAENGDLTEKFYAVKNIIDQYFHHESIKIGIPNKVDMVAYPVIHDISSLSLWDSLNVVPRITSEDPVCMEMLDINNKAGQSYGYIFYRSKVNIDSETSVEISGIDSVKDQGILMVDEVKKLYIEANNRSDKINLGKLPENSEIQIDVLIENAGRTNWKEFNNQRKGLLGPLSVNGKPVKEWTIFPYEMKTEFINQLSESILWKVMKEAGILKFPYFYKASFEINSNVYDTYIDMSNWGKGVVFVNGKNLGRYWSIGPQLCLYLPAPWLNKGTNEIIIFEEFKNGDKIKFSESMNYLHI